MTEKKDTADNEASKLPEEPEQLMLWRKLAAIRDDLIAAIPRWESADHPITQDHAKIAAIYGGHGLTERAIREGDELARREAQRLRARLTEIDYAVNSGTRTKAGNRGISVEQLRELVAPSTRIEIARAALEAWWENREDRDRRHSAALAIYRLQRGTDAAPGDFGQLPDLDALREEDLAYRRERDGLPSGGTGASVGRVLRRLLGERVA